MNYIINPAWFYWVNVADSLVTILVVFLIVTVVMTIIGGVFSAMTLEYGEDDEDHKRAKKMFKCSAIAMIVTAIFLVFIPDKKTLMEMQIARYATYENAEITIDAIKSAVDYIVETMKQLK